MKTACLNGRDIPDRDALHRALREQLGFPDWYGNNLDALYDLLTTAPEPCTVVLRDLPALESNLGDYWKRFLRVLRDCCWDNERVKLEIEA